MRLRLVITKAVGIMAVVCLLVSCGRTNSNSPFAGNGDVGPMGIVLDNSIPNDQRNMLTGDLEMLASIGPTSSASQYAQYVGVPDFSPNNLAGWLAARVKLVVGESFDYASAATAGESRSYNPQIISDETDEVGKIQTVMFNLGAFVYLQGKQKSKLYNLAIGGNTYPVLSPRIGIIQIGEGLFEANSIKGSPVDSMANRMLRAAVFFHEARHSDGNGTNAAFPHSKCTSGDFAGYNSCESNLNGPYVVEAILLKHFYDNCTSCTTSEKTSLQAFIADNLSRLQSGAQFSDERAEAIQ